MRVASWCLGSILLVTACATNLDTSQRRAVVSVVFPWSTTDDDSADLAIRATQAMDLDEVILNLFFEKDVEHVPRLLAALVERGDSIIVALGRTLLPAISDVAAQNRDRTFFWLGWGTPPNGFPAEVQAWWANPDSFQVVVSTLAVQENSLDAVIIVGDAVSHRVLSRLQNSGIAVEQRSVAESTSRGADEAPSFPRRAFLVLERPRYALHGLEDRVYWAAEGPPESENVPQAELRTDWLQALSVALKWHFDRGGTPPGATADRWLTVKLHQGGGDSS